jgi:methionyl-tRNA formyltransferase
MTMGLRVVFFGSPDFATPSLDAIADRHDVVAVVTQPDRPAGRGRRLQAPAAKTLALARGLVVLQPTKLRDGVVAQQLAALKPDLFVVVAYGRILPPDLLAVPRLGPWNVHASILPKFRGAAPIQWAVIRGERSTGVTIMRMDAGLDTGAIAAFTTDVIRDDDTAGSLAARLSVLGASLLVETLPTIVDGSVVLRAQEDGAATLAPPLRKEDGQLNFSQSALVVSAQARGVDPWPGATVLLQGAPTKVFGPTIVTGSGKPGEVLGLLPQGLAIACGQDAVAFAELQIPGRKRMPAQRVLAGHPLPPRTVVGEV